MVPWGGAEAMLGSSPFAIAFADLPRYAERFTKAVRLVSVWASVLSLGWNDREIARALVAARREARPHSTFPGPVPLGLGAAYAVQEAALERPFRLAFRCAS
jgi:hypothetical protein